MKVKGIYGDAHDADLVASRVTLADANHLQFIDIYNVVTYDINDASL
jgi:hypothetical protein